VRADLRSTLKEHAAIIRSEDAPAEGAAARAVVASGGGGGGGGGGGMGFQRKIQVPSRQEAAVGAVDAAHPAMDLPPLHDADEEDRLRDALMTAEARCGHGGYGGAGGADGGGGAGGGAGGRQQLMVVASLIDKVPNLAGLARTAEVLQVWNASLIDAMPLSRLHRATERSWGGGGEVQAHSLALASTAVLKHDDFKRISVTAEQWVPIVEVGAGDDALEVFLDARRAEGWALVGLEQTTTSVCLTRFRFPPKTLLLLGREKEGIPVQLIHKLDAYASSRSSSLHASPPRPPFAASCPCSPL
jgi:tRNA guanosine-2'-O-methyltransferase